MNLGPRSSGNRAIASDAIGQRFKSFRGHQIDKNSSMKARVLICLNSICLFDKLDNFNIFDNILSIKKEVIDYELF